MNKSIVMAVLLACVAGGLLWQQQQDRRALQQLRGELSQLRPQMEERQLQAEERLWASRIVAQRAPAPAPPAAAVPAPRPEPAAARPPVIPRATEAELVANVERRFQREPVDAAFSADTRRLVEQELVAQLPDRRNLRAVECRGTLCRIDLEFQDASEQERYLAGKFDIASMWKGPYLSLPQAEEGDGAIHSVIFLSRGDQQLLTPDP